MQARKGKNQKSKLPLFFKPLLWSYRFSAVNPDRTKERIIVNTINYGNWKHWQWIVNYYGKNEVRRTIENLAASEFRPNALLLAESIFGIKRMKYATRGDKIRASKNF